MSNIQISKEIAIKSEVFGVYFNTGSTMQFVAFTDKVSKAEKFIDEKEAAHDGALKGLFSWRYLGFSVAVMIDMEEE